MHKTVAEAVESVINEDKRCGGEIEIKTRMVMGIAKIIKFKRD